MNFLEKAAKYATIILLFLCFVYLLANSKGNTVQAQVRTGPRITYQSTEELSAGGGHYFQTWVVRDNLEHRDYLLVCGTGCTITPLTK